LKAVSGADFAINILQDQFVKLQTLMNLQVFFYAAMGCPLLTEFVHELPECFEEGDEMLFFRNKQELLEKAALLSKDKNFALALGEKARIRTLKEHTLKHRALTLNKYLNIL
jgi:spore maturation protein CgeB